MGFSLSQSLQSKLGSLQYAAQSFLPGVGANIPAVSIGDANRAVLPQTPAEVESQARAQDSTFQGILNDIGNAVNLSGSERQGMIDAANEQDNTLFGLGADALQRGAFFILGAAFLVIGVTMVARRTTDAGLDDALKRSQLELNKRAIEAGNKPHEITIAPEKPEPPAPSSGGEDGPDPRPDPFFFSGGGVIQGRERRKRAIEKADRPKYIDAQPGPPLPKKGEKHYSIFDANYSDHNKKPIGPKPARKKPTRFPDAKKPAESEWKAPDPLADFDRAAKEAFKSPPASDGGDVPLGNAPGGEGNGLNIGGEKNVTRRAGPIPPPKKK